jgi:exodeoxyribonuclease-3
VSARPGPAAASVATAVTVLPTVYGDPMRLATWNVNSAKARLPRLLDWLDTRAPDVVCLQETKLPDAEWDTTFKPDLDRRGYAYVHVGEGRWNGVAILSRVGLDDVAVGFAGQPGFPDPAQPAEARVVSATCAGLRVWSVYVPNGRTPDDPHFGYKLAWLKALAAALPADTADTVVCGDMNIAPTDADVWDIRKFGNSTHVTPEERKALAELKATGLTDVVRDRWPDTGSVFSYWDYRAGAFHQDLGMRIDLVLAGAAVAGRVQAAWIDRQARKGSGPSDHAPVMVDLDEAPDGDIGPVVPPPSAPRRR